MTIFHNTITSDLFLEAAKRKTPGVILGSIPGFVLGPPPGVEVTVWTDGVNGTRWHRGHPGSVVMVVSTSPDDTAGGPGLQSLSLDGRNAATGLRSEEDVVLNGTTPVFSTVAFDHLNASGAGNVFGSNGSAVGRVTASISGFPQLHIEPGNFSNFGATSVLATNQTGFLLSHTFSATGPAEFRFLATFASETITRVRDLTFVDNGTTQNTFNKFPLRIEPGSVLDWTVKTFKPNINCYVSRTLIVLPTNVL